MPCSYGSISGYPSRIADLCLSLNFATSFLPGLLVSGRSRLLVFAIATEGNVIIRPGTRASATRRSSGPPDPSCGRDRCEHACALGGPSLRRRASALVTDDLALDFAPHHGDPARFRGAAVRGRAGWKNPFPLRD